MPIQRPTIQEIRDRIRADLVQSVNTGEPDTSKHIDPNLRNNFAGGICDSMSGGFDENNDLVEQVQTSLFPTTATGDELDRWGSTFGINQQESQKASGFIIFTGTASSVIPSSTLLQRTDGLEYTTLNSATISNNSIIITSLTRLGSTATAVTSSPHLLATGTVIDSITGAVEPEYNIVNTPIVVTAENEFTYNIEGAPTTPATGSPLVNYTTASVEIEAQENGSNYNSLSGTAFNLVSPVLGVDNICYAQTDGIVGGIDTESDDEYRERILERTSSLAAPFTEAGLPPFIKENNPGVTRVFVQRAVPQAGFTTIFFTRDDDINQIPTATQAAEVKATITDPDTGIIPANQPDDNLIMDPVVGVSIDFIFTGLSPLTEDMQNAITSNLNDYFRNDTIVGIDVTLETLNRIIGNTIDSSGNTPIYTLSSPASDVTINAGEIGVLGTITYPT
jgi:uncharacterized phage protein gp47/JayE